MRRMRWSTRAQVDDRKKGVRQQPRRWRTLETIFHQERHSGRMVLLKSASWRCKKKRRGKKKRGRWIYARENRENSRSAPVRGNSLPFFSPPLPSVTIAISCHRNCIHLSTLPQVFATFQRDFTCPMFNEASKIIGSLTVFVFVSILQVFSLIYIYFWFYDPNFNVSILN